MSETAQIVEIRELVVNLKKPTEKQNILLRGMKKRTIVRAGRRFGKTTSASILAVEKFLLGKRILYAVPTSDQIKRFWHEVTKALAIPIDAGIYYKNETEHIIEVRGTEQRIRAKTAWNADTLRGDYADILILDEWQLMDEAAWGDVGAPMLLDNNGDALFIYTPPSLRSRSTSKARDPRHAAKMFKKALEDTTGMWAAFHFTSQDNPKLSKRGLENVVKDMTRLSYRQEILAEDVTEVPGALWTQAIIDANRVEKMPELVHVAYGIDPSGSTTNEAGVVGAGRGVDGHGYVFDDRSLFAASPRNWAAAAVWGYHEHKADVIVGERNYGGDMVEATIRTVDENVAYKDVIATRGKQVRAQPISALYEQGRVHHVGQFPELESEMCTFVPGNPSPNRMDALVWALTEVMPGQDRFGLLDYLASGQAERDMKAADQRPIIRVTGLADGSTEAVAPAVESGCPKCHSKLVQNIAGRLRCGQCGEQWGAPPKVNLGPSRRDL